VKRKERKGKHGATKKEDQKALSIHLFHSSRGKGIGKGKRRTRSRNRMRNGRAGIRIGKARRNSCNLQFEINVSVKMHVKGERGTPFPITVKGTVVVVAAHWEDGQERCHQTEQRAQEKEGHNVLCRHHKRLFVLHLSHSRRKRLRRQ